MKTVLLSLAFTIMIVKANAQFSENFDATTINNLVANCWSLNGVSMTTQNGEVINTQSIYTAPPTNPGVKIDLYTPVLDFSANSTAISFDYRLTQTLNGNATRSIQIIIVNLLGTAVKSDFITMPTGTGTNIQNYNHTFTSLTPGSYRVAFRLTGANGNGNVRLVFDNLSISNSTLASVSSCVLVPINEITLPVKLASFTATLNNNKTELKWTTASEMNVSHFVIERSIDGQNFSDAGTVFAVGNTSSKVDYSFSDNVASLTAVVIYYRLRSVDVDGKFEYSATRIVRMDKKAENTVTILTYPNPVTNELKVTIPANWQNKKVTYELFNMSGQSSKKIETMSSSQTETINVNSIQTGIYLVKVSCEGQTVQQKVIKK